MKSIAAVAVLVAICVLGWMLSSVGTDRAEIERVSSGADAVTVDRLEPLAVPEGGEPERVRIPSETVEALSGVGPAETEPARGARGTLAVHVTWSDGSDAAGVGVVAVTDRTRFGVSRQFREVTDDAGHVEFAQLRPGKLNLRLDRGAAREDRNLPLEPEIVAGETTVAEVRLERGVDVRGRVVTQRGDPIAGAGVWLTVRSSGWTGGRVVALTDAAGKYELRDVPGDQSLGALAPGYARSELVDLDNKDTASGQVTVDLTVAGQGAALVGVVQDADGQPVDDATVAVGRSRNDLDMRSNGTIEERWTTPSTQSRQDGSYRLDSLVAGEHEVWVRASGLPIQTGSVTLVGGETAQMDFVLPEGARLSGVVQDEVGAPISGARVRAFEAPLDETFLQSGQVDYHGPFAHRSTVTDDAGAYELDLLAPGQVWAYAQKPAKKRRNLGDPVLFSKAQLTLVPGDSATWSPQISEGRTITGSIHYRDGAALTGVFVNAREVDGPDSRAIYVEKLPFQFVQLEGDRYDISVQIWDPPPGSKPVQQLAIAPNGPSIELVAGFDSPAEHEPSIVLVRFEDEGERAVSPDTIGVILQDRDAFSWWIGELEDGVWKFELPKPKRYLPIVVSDERVIAIGEPFENTPGETHDLGTLRSRRGGDLVLRIHRPPGTEDAAITATLRLEACRRSESFTLGALEEIRVEDLEPGAARLSFRGAGITNQSRDIEIVSDEETLVTIDVEPAVPVRYRITWDAGDEPGSMTIRFLDRADGGEVHRVELNRLASYSSPIEWTFQAPVGEFTLVAELGSGKSASQAFGVVSLDPDAAPALDLDLR